MMLFVVFCVSDIMENSKMNDAVCFVVFFLCVFQTLCRTQR